MSGGHRSVRGEYTLRANLVYRLIQRRTRDDQLPQSLDEHESRVALVGMPHARIDAHGPEHPDSADTQNPLLPHPELRPAGVEFVHQAAIVRMVGIEVGVEQVNRYSTHHDLPGPHVDRTSRCLHRGEPGLPAGSDDGNERSGAYVVLLVAVFLPAFQTQSLIEVTLAIEQSYADQRNTKVTGRLAVVTGKHAETTRVDRHRVVEPELGAEVGDRPAIEMGIVLCEPGVAVVGLVLHPLDDCVIAEQKVTVAGARCEACRLDPAEQLQRVVPGMVPQRNVDGLKQRPRFPTPAPPQV